jgi:lipoyl(octanoyl) transferase
MDRDPAAVVTLSEARGRSSIRTPAPSVATLPQGDNARWHLWIDETPRPGWANMAIDLALLDRAEQHAESWLRLYQWQPHCLSFGRHEPATRRYDVERIGALGLDTVRRPTGGRAVWHGRELTYAVTAPSQRFGSLQSAYLTIHAMVGDALRRLGAATSLAPRRAAAPVDAGACFAQPAGGEVMAAGRKVVGSAQLRRGAALLQHGSILLGEDQQIVLGLTRGAPGGEVLASSLAVVLGRPVGSLEVAEAIARTAADRWTAAWQRISRPHAILRTAGRYFCQFQSPAWTWAR